MEYSNIGNGVGIFASRSISRVPNLALSNVTLDELANGDITSALGFKDSKGN
jgi:tRNA (Thr-GGU) A37 N-methylase